MFMQRELLDNLIVTARLMGYHTVVSDSDGISVIKSSPQKRINLIYKSNKSKSHVLWSGKTECFFDSKEEALITFREWL